MKTDISRGTFYDMVETAVFEAMDRATKEAFGYDKEGWKDEDLANILPALERHVDAVYKRMND